MQAQTTTYGSSYGWNNAYPYPVGGVIQQQPQFVRAGTVQPQQPVVLSGAPVQQQQQTQTQAQPIQTFPLQQQPGVIYGGFGPSGFGGLGGGFGVGGNGTGLGSTSYTNTATSYRGAEDLNLKASGSFIGPGPDYVYLEDTFDAPKREYVEDFGRTTEKDLFYEKVLKERFGNHLTILPKKPVPAPKPAPPPEPVVTRAIEPPKPSRPNASGDLRIVGTTQEGQTVNAAGWFVDHESGNVNYRWTSRGTVVGYERTLYLTTGMVGAPVVCEATHTWYNVPISATATSSVVTGLPPPPAPAPVPEPVKPTRTLTDVQLQGGPTHANPITAYPIWQQNTQPGQVTCQWYRSLKGAATTKQVAIANANQSVYAPTVDDLHAFLHVRVQQLDENGAPLGEPVEKQVPDSYLVVDKGIEAALAQEFKVNRAVFNLTAAANAAEQKTIALSAQGVNVYNGTAAAGQPIASSVYDAGLRAVLNYDDSTSFTLAMNGAPNMMLRAANPLERDHVVLSIRSFKGLNMAKTEGQVKNVVKMYHKSHADGKY